MRAVWVPKGSPLHVRGKDPFQVGYECDNRITPAYAGKSAEIAAYKALTADHPRMCGEKYKVDVDGENVKGSPPHVRGKDIFTDLVFDEFRITPACAGKRKTAWKGEGKKQDHPRMCGEKIPRT